MNVENYKLFISHSSTDTWVAKQIESKLLQIDSISTFLDEGHIATGDDFDNKILQEIRTSNELLVLFTPWAIKRQYVWLEIGAAWGLGIRLIAILHGVSYEEINHPDIPNVLKRTNTIELNQFEKYFDEVKSRVYEK